MLVKSIALGAGRLRRWLLCVLAFEGSSLAFEGSAVVFEFSLAFEGSAVVFEFSFALEGSAVVFEFSLAFEESVVAFDFSFASFFLRSYASIFVLCAWIFSKSFCACSTCFSSVALFGPLTLR